MKMFRRFFLLAVLLASSFAAAQDIHVDCSNTNACTLASAQSWGSGNQTWIFPTLARNVTVYVYIHNQNTTNAHSSQTLSIFQTPFPQSVAPTLTSNADLWIQDAVTQNTVNGALCNGVNAAVPGTPGASGLGSCYAIGMQAAQIAIRITGAGALGGAPDVFDLSIVQFPTTYTGGPKPGSDSSSGGATIPSTDSLLYISTVTDIDGLANTAAVFPCVVLNGAGQCGGWPIFEHLYDGSGWPRQRSASAATLTTQPSVGSSLVEKGPRWALTSSPGGGVLATVSKAAGGAGVRHVADCISFASASSAAVTAVTKTVVIRDGATGAGTIVWQWAVAEITAGAAGVQTVQPHSICGLGIVGTANTAMTAEWLSLTTGDAQSVNLTGFDVQ